MQSRFFFRIPCRTLLAAVCAFAAHVAAYGTLWPSDPEHGYLVWYEPVVAGLSLASIAGLTIVAGLVLAARRSGRRLWFPGAPYPPQPLGARIARIGGSGLLYLVVQESVERSVAAGTPQFASFTAGQWLVVVVAAGLAALVVACAIQLAEAVIEFVQQEHSSPRERRSAPGWSLIVSNAPGRRPLALRSALRAPPALFPA